jgi:PAS domain S-box-containing protein
MNRSRTPEGSRQNGSLLAEAESLASVGSWEQNLVTGEGRRSPNLCRMLDLSARARRFSDKDFWELIHHEDRRRVAEIIQTAMENAKPYEYQARFVLKDGRERVFLTRGRPIFNDLKQIVKRIGVTQDITERVRFECALQNSEARYRDLVENSRDLICLHDLCGKLLWMNEQPAKLLGYLPEDLIGRRIPDMLDEEGRSEFDGYIARIQRDGHAEGLMRVVARSGERRIWQYQNTLKSAGPDSPVIRGLAHDVTELKRTERSLRRERERVQGLFEIAQRLTQSLEVNQILKSVRSGAMVLFGAEVACTGVRTVSGFSCRRSFQGTSDKEVTFKRTAHAGVLGWMVENRRSYIGNHCGDDFRICTESRRVFDPRNVLCTPIFELPKREIVAFIAVVNKPTDFGEADVATAEAIAQLASVAIQNASEFQRAQNAEKQLQRLSAEVIGSRDLERRRVAYILNEQMAQDLAGIGMRLADVRSSTTLARPGEQAIAETQEIIGRAVTGLRELSSSLHPGILDLGGLWLAIRDYADRFARETGVRIICDIGTQFPRLPAVREIAIFRIVQQCLTSAYARSATSIQIRSKLDDLNLIVTITDCGQKIGVGPAEGRLQIEVVEMAERAREIGAELRFEPDDTGGARVRLSVPQPYLNSRLQPVPASEPNRLHST